MRDYGRFSRALALAAMLISIASISWAEPLSDTTTSTLTTCPVSGGKLGEMGEPVVKEIGGREVRFCCAGCEAPFRAKLDENNKKIDDMVIAQEKSGYPLDTCVVSGGKLDAMGNPVDFVYGNRLFRLCCRDCIDTLKKDPAKYIAMLDAAVIEKQKPSYPLKTCVVKGKPLGDTPVDFVIGNRLVELCCKGCAAEVKTDPAKYLALIDEAAKNAK